MPKFLYSPIAATIFLWILIYSLMSRFAPDKFLTIVVVLVLLFAAISLTTSLVLFFVRTREQKGQRQTTDQRTLYRAGFKKSVKLAVWITIILAIKALIIEKVF